MPTSDFWRDLAVQFRALPDPYGMLRASGHYIIGSGVAWGWELTGGASASLRTQFAALARRGAFQIENADANDLLTAWLEALRLERCNFEFGEHLIEGSTDSGTHHMLGSINRVCEASANFCQILESRALQTEFDEKHAPADNVATPVSVEAPPKRLGATINCPRAARKMEAYLETNGIGLTAFANQVGTTDRTLRSFRKTGKVKRSIFDDIAKAMGTTKEDLLKK
jgi:hypothetical protein